MKKIVFLWQTLIIEYKTRKIKKDSSLEIDFSSNYKLIKNWIFINSCVKTKDTIEYDDDIELTEPSFVSEKITVTKKRELVEEKVDNTPIYKSKLFYLAIFFCVCIILVLAYVLNKHLLKLKKKKNKTFHFQKIQKPKKKSNLNRLIEKIELFNYDLLNWKIKNKLSYNKNYLILTKNKTFFSKQKKISLNF